MREIPSPLSGFRSPFGRLLGGGFSPAILFANDEPGVWYDPSDLTTLFQDDAGTTPVTTAGQTVGLMLDKSQGLTLGPELADLSTASVSNFDGSNGVIDADNNRFFNTSPTVSNSTYPRVLWGGLLEEGKTYFINVVAERLSLVNSGGGGTSISATDSFSGYIVGGSNGNFTLGFDGTETFDIAISVSVKELLGYHATQPTAAARPTYQTDGTLHWLEFDGVDDFMVTPTITPGIDKVQVFTGVRKLSDNNAVVAESSPNGISNNGSIVLASFDVGRYACQSRGTIGTSAFSSTNTSTPPSTDVLTGLGDISGDSVILRSNGVQSAESTSDQGTGNYLSYPTFIGARAGTSFRFNGHIYSLVTRFGANLETSTIETTETYVAGQTGVTLA